MLMRLNPCRRFHEAREWERTHRQRYVDARRAAAGLQGRHGLTRYSSALTFSVADGRRPAIAAAQRRVGALSNRPPRSNKPALYALKQRHEAYSSTTNRPKASANGTEHTE